MVADFFPDLWGIALGISCHIVLLLHVCVGQDTPTKNELVMDAKGLCLLGVYKFIVGVV